MNMSDLKNIMVFSRNTKYCRKTVHAGIELARKQQAKLYIAYIIHNPFGIEGWYVQFPSLPTLEEEYQKLQEEGRKDLEAIIKKEAASGLEIEVIVFEGEVLEEVQELIEEKKIDLLVVSAHREGRLEHFLFGHIIENLVRNLPCSLMLVKDEPGDTVSS